MVNGFASRKPWVGMGGVRDCALNPNKRKRGRGWDRDYDSEGQGRNCLSLQTWHA